MTALVPARVEVLRTAPDDPRVGMLLGTRLDPGQLPRVAIVGFPSDEGVRRNGGRAGAAEGPRAIRSWLYRFTADAVDPLAFTNLLGSTRDLGDVPVTGHLENDQRLLADAIAPLLRSGVFVIVLGGGHETAFGHFLGYVGAAREIDVLNWDAHADVREPFDGHGHSGSPFRQMLEHPAKLCRSYAVAGLQPHAVSGAHVEYVRARGRAVFADTLDLTMAKELYARLGAAALVSFDLDAVDQAHAPGVSAPATGGLDPHLWLELAELAGRTPAVTSADVVELAPTLDRDGQTARLGALTVWRLLRGLATRPDSHPDQRRR